MADDRTCELLEKYDEMHEELDSQEEALVEVDNHNLMEKLERVETLFGKVGEAETAVVDKDSELLRRLSTISLRRTQAYRTGLLTFQPMQFADRLVATVGGSSTLGADHWAHLGLATACFFPPAPGLTFLYGTLPGAPPERRPRAQRARFPDRPAEVVSPEQVAEAAPRDTTARRVDDLRRALRRACKDAGWRPVGFFEFVYHPTDFSATVENLFHTSILVRERYARLRLDDRDLPVLEPAGADGDAADDDKAFQALLSVDHDSWREVVRIFGIRRAMVPTVDADIEQPSAKRSRRS